MVLMGDKESYDKKDNNANKNGKEHKKSNSDDAKSKAPAMDFSSVRKILSEDDVDIKSDTSGATGLLQRFANALHNAATEWSHTEFASARVYLSNAETILREGQGRLEKVSRSRRGTLACEHDDEGDHPSSEEGDQRIDSNNYSNNNDYDNDNSINNDNKNNNKQTLNQKDEQFDYSVSWTPVIISSMIGIVLGYFHSTQHIKRRI